VSKSQADAALFQFRNRSRQASLGFAFLQIINTRMATAQLSADSCSSSRRCDDPVNGPGWAGPNQSWNPEVTNAGSRLYFVYHSQSRSEIGPVFATVSQGIPEDDVRAPTQIWLSGNLMFGVI
jgi:hypothetical protein